MRGAHTRHKPMAQRHMNCKITPARTQQSPDSRRQHTILLSAGMENVQGFRAHAHG